LDKILLCVLAAGYPLLFRGALFCAVRDKNNENSCLETECYKIVKKLGVGCVDYGMGCVL
jgi:hypothetical protein